MLLPDLGHACDMPLFYHAEGMLLDAGADGLRVEYAYRYDTGYHDPQVESRRRRLVAGSSAALRAGLAQRPYRRVTFVGKTLGTLAMGHLLGEVDGHDVRSISLTPLLHDDEVRGRMPQRRGPALVVIGTADDHYEAAVLERLRDAGAQVVIIAGADDSLDIAGNPIASVATVGEVIPAMRPFVAAG